MRQADMLDATCSIEGCTGKLRARGWCARHYERWYKYDDPLAGGPAKPPKGPRIGRRCSPQQSFWSKVKVTPTCWLWQGALDAKGYGILHLNGKGLRAHRFSWDQSPDRHLDPNMELDHLCRVRNCVRPSHLEQVPGLVNILRSENPAARNARKSHCVRGHEFTAENTYVWSKPNGRTVRICRECRR